MNRKLIFQQSSEHRQHFLLSFASFLFLTLMRIFGPWGDNKPLIRLKKYVLSKTQTFFSWSCWYSNLVNFYFRIRRGLIFYK